VKTNRSLAIAFFALALYSVSARAASISQTFNVAGDFHPHQFDPALGTLNFVSAELDGVGSILGQVGYFPPPPIDPRLLIEPGLATVHADGGFVRVSHPDLDLAVDLFSTPVVEPIHPDEVRIVQVSSGGVRTNSTNDVSSFVGTGDVIFFFGGYPGVFVVDPAPYISFEGIVDQFVSASFTLTYHYTAVPEPSSVILAAFGLIVMAAWGWRRSRC